MPGRLAIPIQLQLLGQISQLSRTVIDNDIVINHHAIIDSLSSFNGANAGGKVTRSYVNL
jgi:hypothetical protein